MGNQSIKDISQAGTEQVYSCHRIQDWLDFALVVSFVACLTIGIIATMGYLNSIGTTNATYLSYGMYGGAVLAFIAEMGNLAARGCQQKTSDSHVIAPSFRPRDPRFFSPVQENVHIVSNPELNFDELQAIKEASDTKLQDHFEGVRALLLKSTYNNELEYYSFYYHLSTISVYILQHNPTLKEGWQRFLESIHGKELINLVYEGKHYIDCSRELRRLKGEQPELKVEQVEDPNDPALKVVNEIIREAFGGGCCTPNAHNRCFVVYEDREGKKEIVGCIFLRNKNGEIYVHTLARRASAVRWGITEKFAEELSQILAGEKGKKVTCHVDLDNNVAINIYKKLGFDFPEGDKGEAGYMVLKSQGI